MKFTFLILILIPALLFLACEDNSASTDKCLPERAVVVANYADGGGSLSALNLDNGDIVEEIAGLGDTPNDMLLWNGHLLVINSSSNHLNMFEIMPNGKLVSVDTLDLGLESGNMPQFGALFGNRLFVTNNETASVSVYNLTTRSLISNIAVGDYPGDICIVGGRAYVANSEFDPISFGYGQGNLSVINCAALSVIDTISVPTNPQYITSDNQDLLHVVCTGNYADVAGSVVIIDTRSNAVLDTVEIGGKPTQITVAPNGVAYMTAFGEWGEENPGYVFSYVAATGEILRGFDNPIEVGNGAQRIITTPDGSIYLTCYGADRLEKIDGSSVIYSELIGDGPTPLIYYER